MDIGFDQDSLRQALSADTRQATPEWCVLRARLEAAWSARHVLFSLAQPDLTDQGSFDAATARAITGFGPSTLSINPTALGNGKPNDGIEGNVVGELLAGGRGT